MKTSAKQPSRYNVTARVRPPNAYGGDWLGIGPHVFNRGEEVLVELDESTDADPAGQSQQARPRIVGRRSFAEMCANPEFTVTPVTS